jgi:hypothetical protein
MLHGLTLMAKSRIENWQIQYHIQPFYTFLAANSMPIQPQIDYGGPRPQLKNTSWIDAGGHVKVDAAI